MEDIIYYMQQFMEPSALVNTQLEFPQARNKLAIKKMLASSQLMIDFLLFVGDSDDLGWLDFIDFTEITRKLFVTECELDATSPIMSAKLFEEKEAYDILVDVVDRHPSLKALVCKDCMNKPFFKRDSYIWGEEEE